ncbi:MAG: histidine kinase [Solirubrobacteraceae bacterium]|nr:histidine kinase [Solirubrobacteraceae bacterium]
MTLQRTAIGPLQRPWTSRWMALLLMTRLFGAAVAVLLLVVHRVTAHDGALIIAVLAFTAVSLAAFTLAPRLQLSPAAWFVDSLAVLALVTASEDWRSPFYVLMLTALILPATGLPFRRALAWGVTFMLGYLGVAVYAELDTEALENSIRLETIATHLMVPLVVTLALAYAADVLERLRDERLRSERLAVESERQRIAWELHDSAKQRVHAAHLVLSALHGQIDGAQAELVSHALGELRAAGADMDTSVAELRTPLEGRSVQRLLRERAAQLAPASDAEIVVRGTVGELPAHVAAHAYRIGAEALTNAVRHGDAAHIEVLLSRNGANATIEVCDDGRGLPAIRRPGSNGLRSMRARAETIGAALSIGQGADGRGTRVHLRLATDPREGNERP